MPDEATILHADLDAFYASVEQRDDPSLRGRPVIVGMGVVLSSSYEARACGVRTAMGGRQAKLLCPRAVVVSPRMSAYAEASKAVFAVFVHPGIEELGRVYRPHLAIHATPTAFAAALDQLAAPNDIRWRDETKAAHADYLAFSEKPTAVPGPVNMGEIVVGLRDVLPADAIVTTGAGNFSIWVQRFHRYRKYGTLYAPASGSMGYGLPSAVAMKRTMPDRTVVAFCGDGDFMMTGQEFATAVQYELPLIASSSTTACTAPSACIRSATTPAA